MKRYDTVVIGSGVGGSSAAWALRDGGQKVLMVEEDLWGGTCPNRGCDPKKVLAAGVEVVERNNQLAGKGFSPISSINWPALMDFKRSFTQPYPAQFKKDAEDYGVETLHGRARFLSATQVQVEDEVFEADTFVVATGQRPALLNIEGKEHLLTSNDFLELDHMPPSMTFIGGGYIAFELASIAGAAGCEVTILDSGSRPLLGFDEGLAAEMVKAYKARGIHFAFNVNIQKVRREGEGFVLTGQGYSERTDCVICAAGRVPNTEHLGLEKAGVEYGKKGIPVDENLRTSNPAIFACGDVLDKQHPRLTPVSSFEGKYVARKILEAGTPPIQYPPVATVVFGSPKLAQVGVTPAQAKEQPGRYTLKEVDMTDWFNYRRVNDPVSKARLVYEGETLMGAAVLNHQADDIINTLLLLIQQGVTHQELTGMIFASPTFGSDLCSLV